MSIVYTGVPHTGAEILGGSAEIGVATVHEAQDRTGLKRPICAGARAVGSAVTVSLAPASKWMLHVVVEQCKPGDIVVAAPTSLIDAGNFGELLATSLAAQGVRGLILADDDGGVVVQRTRAEAVPVASRSREDKEAGLKAGKVGLDISGMREALAQKGLQYRRYGT